MKEKGTNNSHKMTETNSKQKANIVIVAISQQVVNGIKELRTKATTLTSVRSSAAKSVTKQSEAYDYN